jgi:putative tricarboxylic transport membrane protein
MEAGFDFSPILNNLALLTRPDVIGLVLLGNLIGLFFGVLPGVSGGQAFIVLLPLTFGWQPEVAIWFLMGMLGATSFGGAMSAILINVPGDTQNAATTFDGYPMTQRGEAMRALGIAATSNILGTMLATLVLVGLFPVMRTIVLSFGPPELFGLAVLGLFMIALAAQGSFLKGLVGGGLGVLLALIGFSSAMGVSRFTLGRDYLWDGVQIVALFVGLFAIAQSIDFCVAGSTVVKSGASFTGWRNLLVGAGDVFREWKALLRSAAIGCFGGMIPGIGATAASFISYAVAKQFSNKPQMFHKGNPEGIIAAETAVNAKEPGGLMPMLAFGIPGSIEAALILAALILHGVQPGPFLLRDRPGVVWSIVLALLVANVFGTLLGVFMSNWLAKLTQVRVVYMAPVMLALCLVGTYSFRGNLWDMFVAIIAGIVGYMLSKAGFSVVTLVIGFLLGEVAERTFFQSMSISNNDFFSFFTLQRPALLLIFAFLLIVILAAFWRTQQLRRGARHLAAEAT